MTYELAKELKDVGYKMDYNLDDFCDFDKRTADINLDLNELIKDCGSAFIELAQGENADGTTWSAEAYPVGTIETGNTPEEAVAKLWITLNTK